jgi:GAF domain-containing protein
LSKQWQVNWRFLLPMPKFINKPIASSIAKSVNCTSLQQVSKRIAEQLRIDDLLQLIADKAVELSHVSRADIFRLDADGSLRLAATHGAPANPAMVPQSIRAAVRDGCPLAVLNAFKDSRFLN